MNLAHYCTYWAAMRGDKPAAVFKGESLTWAELDRRANAMAASLTRLGAGQGDRVGCLLNNCLEWVVTWCAALKAGAILVPLNSRYGDGELHEIIATVGCAALVSVASEVERLAPAVAARANGATGIHLFALETGAAPIAFDDAIKGDSRPPLIDVRPEDIAVVTFTSGSTGLPKGAMLSHRAIRAMGMSTIAANRFTSEERGRLPREEAHNPHIGCSCNDAHCIIHPGRIEHGRPELLENTRPDERPRQYTEPLLPGVVASERLGVARRTHPGE